MEYTEAINEVLRAESLGVNILSIKRFLDQSQIKGALTQANEETVNHVTQYNEAVQKSHNKIDLKSGKIAEKQRIK